MILVTPLEVIAISSIFSLIEDVKKIIERGATFRTITDVSYSGIEFIKEALAVGENVRHLSSYRGMYFAALDKKICLH